MSKESDNVIVNVNDNPAPQHLQIVFIFLSNMPISLFRHYLLTSCNNLSLFSILSFLLSLFILLNRYLKYYFLQSQIVSLITFPFFYNFLLFLPLIAALYLFFSTFINFCVGILNFPFESVPCLLVIFSDVHRNQRVDQFPFFLVTFIPGMSGLLFLFGLAACRPAVSCPLMIWLFLCLPISRITPSFCCSIASNSFL